MSSSTRPHSLLFVLAPLALAPLADAGVLVVDVSGTPYTSIQAAVDAAVDGDIILVRANDSSSAQIRAKSLTVVADGAAQIACSYFSVSDLSAKQHVSISGLRSSGLGVTFMSPIVIESCAGSVRFSDCTFTGGMSSTTYEIWPTVFVNQSADVTFTNCEMIGTHNLLLATPGQGLLVQGESNVSLFDTIVRGGDGGDGEVNGNQVPQHGFDAAAAIGCANSRLFVSGGSATGGVGGDGMTGVCADPLVFPTSGGSGGRGVLVQDEPGSPPSLVRLLDAALVGGAGGAGGSSTCPTGQPGLAGEPYGGSVVPTVVAGSRRGLATIAPVHAGQPVAVSVSGQPADRAYLLVGDTHVSSFDPVFHGRLLVQQPFHRLYLGTLDAFGELEVSLASPRPTPGVIGVARTAQVVFEDSASRLYVSGSTPLVMLDANL